MEILVLLLSTRIAQFQHKFLVHSMQLQLSTTVYRVQYYIPNNNKKKTYIDVHSHATTHISLL